MVGWDESPEPEARGWSCFVKLPLEAFTPSPTRLVASSGTRVRVSNTAAAGVMPNGFMAVEEEPIPVPSEAEAWGIVDDPRSPGPGCGSSRCGCGMLVDSGSAMA